MNSSVIEASVMKVLMLLGATWTTYIYPYFGGVTGGLLFLFLQKSDDDFSARKVFQRVTAGWLVAIIANWVLRKYELMVFSNDLDVFVVSLISGFLSFSFLKWAIDDGGIRQIGGWAIIALKKFLGVKDE